jgi:hypothetical protein
MDLPDVLDFDLRIGLVGAQNEVRPMRLRVPPLRESDVAVPSVMLEAVGFERDRAPRVLVVVFAVAWRVRVLAPVSSMAIPTDERLIEFFENPLAGLCAEIRVAFVALEVGLERAITGNVAASVPDTLSSPPANVPEFCGVHESFALVSQSEPLRGSDDGKTKHIQSVTHLRLVPYRRSVCSRDGLDRRT